MGQLSGGERNRVHLAKLLAGGGNLILLDEPTNDLDVDTLRALEEALVGWSGCAMITSHDRWFLDRIATHILAFEGDSQVTWFEGNYQEYEDHRRRTLGEEADRPQADRLPPPDHPRLSGRRGGRGARPSAYCRPRWARSSASGSWIRSPLTSTVTLRRVPVKRKGLV